MLTANKNDKTPVTGIRSSPERGRGSDITDQMGNLKLCKTQDACYGHTVRKCIQIHYV